MLSFNATHHKYIDNTLKEGFQMLNIPYLRGWVNIDHFDFIGGELSAGTGFTIIKSCCDRIEVEQENIIMNNINFNQMKIT